MQIGLKLGDNVWHESTQPWVRVDAGAWRRCSKLLGKLGDNQWHEIWPGRIVYVHTGYGYGMTVAACFGYPTSPGNYIFYNNGIIGGVTGGSALQVGNFPPGSTVTIINQGRIQGIGGRGGWYNSNRTAVLPEQGGTAIYLNYPCHLDNVNGIIWGGGGGGGGAGEWGGSNDNNAPGGGGAGIPEGQPGAVTWRPGYTYDRFQLATSDAGGWTWYDGGRHLGPGGAPGAGGGGAWAIGSSKNIYQTTGGAPGYWIIGAGNLLSFNNPNPAACRGLQA